METFENNSFEPRQPELSKPEVSGKKKGGFFRRREYISIPWHEIKKIGFDVILVESTGQNIPDFLIDRPY